MAMDMDVIEMMEMMDMMDMIELLEMLACDMMETAMPQLHCLTATTRLHVLLFRSDCTKIHIEEFTNLRGKNQDVVVSFVFH